MHTLFFQISFQPPTPLRPSGIVAPLSTGKGDLGNINLRGGGKKKVLRTENSLPHYCLNNLLNNYPLSSISRIGILIVFMCFSVVGLNFDFCWLNICGFLLYSFYNIGMYFVPLIEVSKLLTQKLFKLMC